MGTLHDGLAMSAGPYSVLHVFMIHAVALALGVMAGFPPDAWLSYL